MRPIEVNFVTWRQTFYNWFDLADFIKQRELKGLITEIRGWRYVNW